MIRALLAPFAALLAVVRRAMGIGRAAASLVLLHCGIGLFGLLVCHPTNGADEPTQTTSDDDGTTEAATIAKSVTASVEDAKEKQIVSASDTSTDEAVMSARDSLASWTQTDRETYAYAVREDGFWHGDIHVVPYGIGWLNMAYDTQRTSPGPFTLFANSAQVEDEDAFHLNVRATRLGLDFTGPDVGPWQMTGKVEIDFFGAALTENRAGLLLRQAYGEWHDGPWRLVGGQTNDVISPLVPSTVNYATVLAAGNIGFRSPQLRVDYQTESVRGWRFTSQTSINRTIVTDFADTSVLLQEGHDAGWPTIMARTALAWLPTDDPAQAWEFGVSGHVGQIAVDFELPPIEQDRKFRSWSLNADLRLPFTPWFGVQGEFFTGETLSTYLGGINQGVDALLRTSIGSTGGWGELWWKFRDDLQLHVGYGTDDPWNDRLSFGRRTRNQVIYGNVLWDVSPHLNTGVELSHWDTGFVGLAPGHAWRVEMAVKYRF